jgi:cysteine desulfurase
MDSIRRSKRAKANLMPATINTRRPTTAADPLGHSKPGKLLTPVYLDNNSTTRPFPEVIRAMLPFFKDNYANPSSSHLAGRKCRTAIEEARKIVGGLLGAANPSEIVFTSSGTESITHAFACAVESNQHKPTHFVLTTVEHSAVLKTAARWGTQGHKVSFVPVDNQGILDLDCLGRILSKTQRAFVTVVLANNETGVIYPIKEIAALCHKHRALLHIDAVQAVGKMLINVRDIGCDYLSLSAHKFHGPKGAGALYIRTGAPRFPLFVGGHQEQGARAGTENVPGIVGLGVAAAINSRNLPADIRRITQLRDRLEWYILKGAPGSSVNGSQNRRLCNTTNIYFPERDSARLVEALGVKGIFVSSGAACSTGGAPSHVLQAMGFDAAHTNSSLRISLSKLTTARDITIAQQAITETAAAGIRIPKSKGPNRKGGYHAG